MKKFRFWLIATLVVLTALSVFTACGEDPAKEFTVTYATENSEYGTVSCLNGTASVVSGAKLKENTSIKFTATENDGYQFDGWYSGSEKVSDDKVYQITVNSNLSLTAKFKAKTFLLTFVTENATKGTVVGQNGVTSGSLIAYKTNFTLVATANTGYAFVGWYDGATLLSTDANYSRSMPNGDLTLTAKFEIQSFALNFAPNYENRGNIVTDFVKGNLYEYNTLITLTAQELTGYDFDGWYVNDELVSDEVSYSFNMPANEVSVVAQFIPEKRTVDFYDGFIRVDSVEVDYGTPVSEILYEKDYHNLIGWFTDPTFTTRYNFNQEVTQSFSLYANFVSTQITYSVIFVDDDGSILAQAQTVDEGEKVPHVPGDPYEKEGYDFNGWVILDETTGEIIEYYDADKEIYADTVITASYTPKQFNVYFYLTNDNDPGNAYRVQTVEYKKTAIKPETPNEENLIFIKWVYFDDPTVEFNFDSLITDNTDILAEFVEKEPEVETCTVTFLDGPNGNIVDTQVVAKGGSATFPSAPNKVGYTFLGWSEEDLTNIQSDLTVVAGFGLNEYSVTFKDSDGTTLLFIESVAHGDSVLAPSQPNKDGYTFVGWDKPFSNITENTVITALYEVNTFDIIFVDAETGDEIERYIEVAFGTTIAVPATPSKAGYSFVGWFNDSTCETVHSFTDNITGELTIYAKFTIIELTKYTVTFVDPEGNEISVQEVVEGASAIEPSATKKTGYTFVGWDKSFDNITENLVVVAIYDANKYTVTFYGEDNEYLGEVEVSYEQSAVNLAPSAPYKEGKEFIYWSKDISYVTKNMEVTAVYALETRTVYFNANNGDEVVSVVVEYGKCVSIPSTPFKPGSTFKYWYLGEDDENAFDFSTPIYEDITLNACYNEIVGVFVVTFYDENGDKYGNVQVVADGQKAIEPGYINKDNPSVIYIWCLEGEETAFDFNTEIREHINLYAKPQSAVVA